MAGPHPGAERAGKGAALRRRCTPARTPRHPRSPNHPHPHTYALAANSPAPAAFSSVITVSFGFGPDGSRETVS
ncbi:hypothetical protein GCM10018773_42970 [Streptomyces candidus]|nr:hypothetical protein GCM10018773_42970 [Streptomyces candidus]